MHDGDDKPQSAEEVEGYSIYCYGWHDDDIKAEILSYAGIGAAEVVLYKHDGYVKTPKYIVA